MFEINEQSIPVVRTRKALLLLDLQDDFISPGGLLEVEEAPNLLNKILDLLPHFRASGNDIIWIHSWFETSRPVNQPRGNSESVITDAQLPQARCPGGKNCPRPSLKLLQQHAKIATTNKRDMGSSNGIIEADDDEEGEEGEGVDETFLTIPPGKTPRVVANTSAGPDIPQLACAGFDGAKDLVVPKSFYSAFKDGTLMQVMRAKFVTEIYLCGALTNISVFATAMDAARHGYAITILEDCVGYRSKARHDEALRQLMESTGCDIITSDVLIRDLQRKEKLSSRPPTHGPPRREKGADLESMMAKMKLNGAGSSASRHGAEEGTATRPVKEKVAGGAESGGSRDSLKTSEKQPTSIRPPPEADGKKRERVPSKVKTRRRHSKSVPKEIGVSGESGPSTSEKDRISPTSATLKGASQALDSVQTHREAEDSSKPLSNQATNSKASAISSETQATMASKIDKVVVENPIPKHLSPPSSPDEELQLKKSSAEDPSAICEGDTTVIDNLLDDEIADGIFEKVRDEVRWQKMSHQGGDVPRLVAVQGSVAEDGSIPIYRHPSDESPPLLPFSPTVSLIQTKVEEKLGHPVNHVLIQFYRDGTDYISEHSDKTLDIAPNTFIANASLGAQRTMVFRTKKPLKSEDDTGAVLPAQPRQSCRAPLPHNSLCKVGLVTNMRWLHGIRQDKRMLSEKSPAELAFDGGRISLTFRLIGTFLDKDEQKIWGQGATAKTKAEAKTVVNGETPEAEKMIRAFGKENHSTEFDWKTSYGQGFDVLHISNSRKLFLSGDKIADLQVKIILAEYGVKWAEGNLSPSFNWKDGSSSNNAQPIPCTLPIKFVDNDLSKSTVVGDLAIMLYLQSVYGEKPDSTNKSQPDIARQYTRLQQTTQLINKWRAVPFSSKPFRREMEMWEAYATQTTFIAGSAVSVVDFALWPILHEIHGEWLDLGGFEKLLAYFNLLSEWESIKNTVNLNGKEVEKAT
ncbi:hypothetical protein G7Y89_g6168 [Cudoniella acicularis]|uniref:Fe2OG dioxygenase domain-containing protein n=1 Tax=Cudoniella acicularis TaxID=354080 RepID=A0A8H4W504_9HELO|nr:hypothetical protein G7Y89_g6168 [Cudoniella acicularis]